MGVLEKIKASSLMETLVATVLIVITFMIASMVLNNVFVASISGNDQSIRQELYTLQYQYQHGKLDVPHYQELGDWQVEVNALEEKGIHQVIFTARHEHTKKEVVLKITDGGD